MCASKTIGKDATCEVPSKLILDKEGGFLLVLSDPCFNVPLHHLIQNRLMRLSWIINSLFSTGLGGKSNVHFGSIYKTGGLGALFIQTLAYFFGLVKNI